MRIFIAACVPEPIRESLSRLQSSLFDEGLRHIRWVRSSEVHLTLRFCGEISSQARGLLSEKLAPGAPFLPFEARIGTFGVFPKRGAPRVLFLGLEPSSALVALANWVEKRVQEAGLPPESRPFQPHLTVGRFRPGSPPVSLTGLPLAPALLDARFHVDSVAVFRSHLGAQGARHEVLSEHPLLGEVVG